MIWGNYASHTVHTVTEYEANANAFFLRRGVRSIGRVGYYMQLALLSKNTQCVVSKNT